MFYDIVIQRGVCAIAERKFRISRHCARIYALELLAEQWFDADRNRIGQMKHVVDLSTDWSFELRVGNSSVGQDETERRAEYEEMSDLEFQALVNHTRYRRRSAKIVIEQ